LDNDLLQARGESDPKKTVIDYAPPQPASDGRRVVVYGKSRLIAVLLLAYLIAGTMAEDWFLGGEVSSHIRDPGVLKWVIFGAVLFAGLFILGIWYSRRHGVFFGFRRWEWIAMVGSSVLAGILIRRFCF
jgi:hypothetical protein